MPRSPGKQAGKGQKSAQLCICNHHVSQGICGEGPGYPTHHHCSPSFSTTLPHFLSRLLISGPWLRPTPKNPEPSEPPLSCQPPQPSPTLLA